MNYSTFNNIPIDFRQKTPEILKNKVRERHSDNFSFLDQASIAKGLNFRDQSEISKAAQRYSLGAYKSGQDYPSFKDPTTSFFGQKTQEYHPTTEGFFPKNQRVTETFGKLPRETQLKPIEAYNRPPQGLEYIMLFNNIVNLGLTLLSNIVILQITFFLIKSLPGVGEAIVLDPFKSLKIGIMLSLIILSRHFMMRHYDIFINSNDILRTLFSTPSFLHLGIFLNVFATIALCYDISSAFFPNPTVGEEAFKIITAFLAGVNNAKGFLVEKKYLLPFTLYETIWSSFGTYSPKRMIITGMQLVLSCFSIVFWASFLNYTGIMSFFFEHRSALFTYSDVAFPGFTIAFDRIVRYLFTTWISIFIIELQTQFLRRLRTRVARQIGDSRLSVEPLYHFYINRKEDEEMMNSCLRFLDSKRRYECRNALLRRQYSNDVESKTVWHVFSESVLSRLEHINRELERLKASSWITKDRLLVNFNVDTIVRAARFYVTMTPEVVAIIDLYHNIMIATHQCSVLNKVFRELKILHLDSSLRNYHHDLRTYYQGLYSSYITISNMKQLNKNSYIADFIQALSQYERVIKEGLLMLNSVISTL